MLKQRIIRMLFISVNLSNFPVIVNDLLQERLKHTEIIRLSRLFPGIIRLGGKDDIVAIHLFRNLPRAVVFL
ncbi:hypothetical protein D3C85_1688290 [compost metagenome]